MTLQLSHMSSRNQFGGHLGDVGMAGQAVEVGTHRGEFAHVLVQEWGPGGVLWCVDPWENQSARYAAEQAGFLPDGAGDRGKDFRVCQKRLRDYEARGRVKYLREDSEAAAKRFKDGALDFVYLDGDHSYDGVSLDLRLWWPKIGPGGILAGHDFLCPGPAANPENWGRFIQPAVLSFFSARGPDVYLIVEEGGLPWSWYVEKPK